MLKAKGVAIGAIGDHGPEGDRPFGAARQDQGLRRRHACSSPPTSSRLTLILKQAKDQQVTARIITTGGSVSPDQLIEQAGEAANGTYHLVFFTPWFPDAVKNPDVAKAFMAKWNAQEATMSAA